MAVAQTFTDDEFEKLCPDWVKQTNEEIISLLEEKTGAMFIFKDCDLLAIFPTEAERLQWKLTWL